MKIIKQNWITQQLFIGWKKFEISYILVLLGIQILAFIIAPDSWIGMISGLTGVIALVYGMKGRKISFIFGLIQTISMAYIAWISHAYGSFAMDLIYVISQPIGWFMWGRDEATHSFQPKTRRLIFGGAFIAWGIGWFVLATLHGQLPY